MLRMTLREPIVFLIIVMELVRIRRMTFVSVLIMVRVLISVRRVRASHIMSVSVRDVGRALA